MYRSFFASPTPLAWFVSIFIDFINASRYHRQVIKSFHCKETEKLFNGRFSKRLPPEIQKRGKMRLDRINAASALDDLRVPPSHRLEALEKDRKDQHSIRINDQWRVCFIWKDGNAHNVEITDYHLAETAMSHRDFPPIHPGDHLTEFLEEFGVSQYRLAKEIDVPPRRVNEIVHGKRSVTADTALRLGRYFNTTPEFWMNLQMRYALELERERLKPRLMDIHPVASVA